jgi:hypothetical protein
MRVESGQSHPTKCQPPRLPAFLLFLQRIYKQVFLAWSSRAFPNVVSGCKI